MKFQHNKNIKDFKVITTVLIGAALLLVVVGVVLVRNSYTQNLKPISSTDKTHVYTVAPGATTGEIADTLKAKGIIRSDWAFEWYVRNHQLRDQLKAGTYVLSEKQSVQEIVEVIIEGKVATDLVTIVPGKRIDEIKKDFVEAGFAPAEVEKAFEPAQYKGHAALTDKPESASLEGYLYPESFLKTAETTPREIIQLALDETEARLTPEIRQAIATQGMTLHQGITLASMIEGEVTSEEDRAKVAQVFLKRLKEDIRLESNATDEYSKINPDYNTYKIKGLPPGPVSNFSESALRAVAFPAGTDWLYFVSGDDKRTHFSKTLEEHEANIEKYCTTLCGR